MSTQTVFDIEVNISALVLAILRDDVNSPERAFQILFDRDKCRKNVTTEKLLELKQSGMKFKDIGEIYGLSPSAVYRRLQRSGLR